MLLPLLWRPRRALSYDVATWADTSSNQASKDPCQLRCGYSNLGKIYLSFTFFNNVGRVGCGLSCSIDDFPGGSTNKQEVQGVFKPKRAIQLSQGLRQ
jgi:hypothetical protein